MPKSLFVNKSIRIEAHAKWVWLILTDSEISQQWVSEFGIKDGKINSQWQADSEVSWQDQTGETLVTGKVISVSAPHHLHFSVIDVNSGPMPDSTDEDGLTYQLVEANDKTTLTVKQGDFGKMSNGGKFHSATEKIWNKVLQKVKNLAEHMQNLENKGFKEIRICPLPPQQDFGEHTHDLKTAHVILNGQLTIIDNGQSQTYHPGDYIEFPANTTHKALGDDTGGDMIVGVKP
jgi:quercetin dioxygenase-like cupin family protein